MKATFELSQDEIRHAILSWLRDYGASESTSQVTFHFTDGEHVTATVKCDDSE